LECNFRVLSTQRRMELWLLRPRRGSGETATSAVSCCRRRALSGTGQLHASVSSCFPGCWCCCRATARAPHARRCCSRRLPCWRGGAAPHAAAAAVGRGGAPHARHHFASAAAEPCCNAVRAPWHRRRPRCWRGAAYAPHTRIPRCLATECCRTVIRAARLGCGVRVGIMVRWCAAPLRRLEAAAVLLPRRGDATQGIICSRLQLRSRTARTPRLQQAHGGAARRGAAPRAAAAVGGS